MSYAHGTTNYNFPQIAGTDRPTFADANEAFRTLDTKLYSLEGSATDLDGRLDTAEGNIVQLQSDVQTAQGTADLAKNTADTAVEQIGITNINVSQNTTRIGNKLDSVAIADPYDTTQQYAVGDVVTYNGQRYRCTTAVTVAEPFDVTKWTGEDVETVLDEIKSDLSDKADASDFTVDIQTFTPSPETHGDLYGNIRFKRSGHVVTFELHGFTGLANQYDNTVLPAGDILANFRPNDDVIVMTTDGSSFYKIVVTSYGGLSVYPYNGITNQNNVSGTFSYIIN